MTSLSVNPRPIESLTHLEREKLLEEQHYKDKEE